MVRRVFALVVAAALSGCTASNPGSPDGGGGADAGPGGAADGAVSPVDAASPDAVVADAGADAAGADAGVDAAPDIEAPGPVDGLAARPGDKKILLSWALPADPDLAGVIVRASTTAPPQSPQDGVGVAEGYGSSVTAAVPNGVTYHFSVFAVDGAGNYSEASSIQAAAAPPWTRTVDIPTFGQGWRANAVGDRIYLSGISVAGDDETFLLELDPAAAVWSNCGTPWPGNGCAQGDSARSRHASVDVGGRLLMLGGCIGNKYGAVCGGKHQSPIEYDVASNTWTNCAGTGSTSCAETRLGVNRFGRSVAGYLAGKVYLLGSLRDPEDALPRLEEYDVASNDWTNCSASDDVVDSCSPVPEALVNRQLTSAVLDGELFVLASTYDTESTQPDYLAALWAFSP